MDPAILRALLLAIEALSICWGGIWNPATGTDGRETFVRRSLRRVAVGLVEIRLDK